MAAAHHGHIICLYAGRAVYCPKMATLQATLKAALECLGLQNGREVHFAFPHSDLAILVEISALAFKNVRDGAILYLCDGRIGPTYPHELALQAQEGQAAARRPPRAVAAAPAAGGGNGGNPRGNGNGQGVGVGRNDRNGDGRNDPMNNGDAAPAPAPPPSSSSSSSAPAAGVRKPNGTDATTSERSRGNNATNGVRTSASNNANAAAAAAAARAARASRRSRGQKTNDVILPMNDTNANGEETVERKTGAARDKETPQPNTSGRHEVEDEEEEEEEDNAPGPSSRNASSSSSVRVKREMMDEDEEDDSYPASRNGYDVNDSNKAGDSYFKKRRLAN